MGECMLPEVPILQSALIIPPKNKGGIVLPEDGVLSDRFTDSVLSVGILR